MNHHIFTLTDWLIASVCLSALFALAFYIFSDILHPRLAERYGWEPLGEDERIPPIVVALGTFACFAFVGTFFFIGDAVGL